MAKYVDDTAIQRVISNTKALLALKVDKVNGKGLSTEDYTTAEKTKLSGIEAGAQVNVIESVKVNGSALTPSSKAVDITVPTKTSDLTNDSGFITSSVNDLSNYYTKTEIDNTISSVYKPAGSVAFASLPTLSASVLGNVYNVTDAFTTTSDFVEGAGVDYPAGTNVVVVDVSATSTPSYKFDVLGGFVDLSGYVPTSRTINGKALSSNISLTASDVGALPSSTVIPTDTNQKIKTASVTFGNDDVVQITAGSNVQVVGDATNKTITISATDTTYSSQSASQGGTTLSLVTTGEKYTWNNKQDAMTAITTSEIDTYFNS